MSTHEEIQADLPLFALGSLDPEERRAIDQHLAAGCDSCERELRVWREVVGMVSLDAPPAAAPTLKAELLARVRAKAPTPAARGTVARRRIGWAVPLAIAAVALLAFAVEREVAWRNASARQADVLAAMERQLDAARGDLGRASASLAEREKDVASLRAALSGAEESLAILQARGLRLVALKETKDAPPAEGHILLSPPAGRALFYAFDLPAVPTDKAYELWWITAKDGPVPAGVFHPDAHGLGRVDATLPADAGAIQAAAVTVEAAGGVPKPQGPMVLIGNVTSPS